MYMASSYITTLILLLFFILSPALTIASSFSPPPLFCKCTCGTNSTIIPLDQRPPPPSTPASSDSGLRLRHRDYPYDPSLIQEIVLDPSERFLSSRDTSTPTHTCADCTRSFCLGYNLPFCKAVQKEEDVITSCFARDSVMDRVVVWGFVVVTMGLLVWAGVRGWVWERLRVVGWGVVGGEDRGRGRYEGLSGGGR